MAKKYVYYYKIRKGTDNVIEALYKGSKLGKYGIEITESEYNRYKNILEAIEDKEGYIKIVTLYVGGTYSVEYLPDEVRED